MLSLWNMPLFFTKGDKMIRRKDNRGRVLKENENQRSNGTYEYKWRDSSRKRHSIYAKTLEELRAREREILRNELDGIDYNAQMTSLNEYFNKWNLIKRGIKDTTKANYIYMYNTFVRNQIGNRRICSLKKSDIRIYYNTLYEQVGLRASTIDTIQSVLHQVFQLAVDDEAIRLNPCDRALAELKKAHPEDTVVKNILTVQQAHEFVKFMKGCQIYNRWTTIFITLMFTGMRIGEVTGLQWDDIDFEKNIIHVKHTLVHYSDYTQASRKNVLKWKMNTPKTKTSLRTVPMLPIVKTTLLEEKKFQEKKKIHCESVVDGYSNFIFLNRFNKTLDLDVINKALRRIIRDCNYNLMDKGIEDTDLLVPHLSCHCFRHTMTTWMYEVRVEEQTRKAILGHTSDDVTNRVYTHISDEQKLKEIARLIDYSHKICG